MRRKEQQSGASATIDPVQDLAYARGAEMLLHDDPFMRLAGVSLIAQVGARHAPGSESWRPACVNLLCSYLRTNTALPDSDLEHGPGGRYWKVAEEACRLLTSMFPPYRSPAGEADIGEPPPDLNLSGATLPTLALSGRLTGEARFDGATFTGEARFDGATFTGEARFDGTTFTAGMLTSRTKFMSNTRFQGATFNAGRPDFYSAEFESFPVGLDDRTLFRVKIGGERYTSPPPDRDFDDFDDFDDY